MGRTEKTAEKMKMLVLLTIVLHLLHSSVGLTVTELHDKYWTIFPKTGNRNSASHLWSSYVVNQVWGTHTKEEIYKLFAGFCPISGSIVRPSRWSKWNDLKIKKATNTNAEELGSVHVCCWPCICDIQQFVKTDYMWINTKTGWEYFKMFVIGDPCLNPSKIPREASELTCKNGVLQGAMKSTNGHVVIGMVQSNDTPAENSAASAQQLERCDNRKKTGYKWGMGKIFVDIAKINPIET